MNGFKLLEVAKRNPSTFSTMLPRGGIESLSYDSRNRFHIVRDLRSRPNSKSYKSSTFDCDGKHLGTMFTPRKGEVPLMFHYGPLDGTHVIDVYDETVASYPKAEVERYYYDTLAELRKIVADAYKSVKAKMDAKQNL